MVLRALVMVAGRRRPILWLGPVVSSATPFVSTEVSSLFLSGRAGSGRLTGLVTAA